MTSRDFCYWLMGVLEVAKLETLDKEQVKTIKHHLDMVFVHEIDPSFPEAQQQAFNEAHTGWSSNSSGMMRC
jgi:hypothetical protein